MGDAMDLEHQVLAESPVASAEETGLQASFLQNYGTRNRYAVIRILILRSARCIFVG